jgi:hypothetical protein
VVVGLLLAPALVTAQAIEQFDPNEVGVSNLAPLTSFISDGADASLACNGPKVAFESGIPAPWPVMVWTGPVYWSTTDDLMACDNGGNQTLGSGEAACADSDETNIVGDPYDTELFSASFDLTGYTDASLRFAVAYNDIGTADKFEVWVWDGGIGALALQWDEDHNEMVTLDLSSYLGLSDVEVSFRYHGNGWNWWVQVDDVSLSCTGIFADGFESGDTTAWSSAIGLPDLVTLLSEEGYDFSEETVGGMGHGDFYFLYQSGVSRFWANNAGMRGLVDLGVTTGSLEDITVPASGYYRFGVEAILDHTYVSLAEEGEDDYYIIFRVTAVSSTETTLEWIYAYRP